MFEHSVPTYWSKGSRDRTLAIVMGYWIEGKIAAGHFSLRPAMRAKVEYLTDLSERYNNKDFSGEGGSSTALARDIVRAMREADVIPDV